MKVVESANEYLINDTEYFYNLDTPGYHPEQIKAFIPKLMASMQKAPPKFSKSDISPTIFANAKECRPVPVKIVTLQNYVTLTRPNNLSPSYWQTSKKGKMIKDQKHILKITNKDIRQMHFIEDK